MSLIHRAQFSSSIKPRRVIAIVTAVPRRGRHLGRSAPGVHVRRCRQRASRPTDSHLTPSLMLLLYLRPIVILPMRGSTTQRIESCMGGNMLVGGLDRRGVFLFFLFLSLFLVLLCCLLRKLQFGENRHAGRWGWTQVVGVDANAAGCGGFINHERKGDAVNAPLTRTISKRLEEGML